MARDFDVKVIDPDEEVVFKGESCVVVNQPFLQKLGIGNVTETIICKNIEFERKE